MSLKIVGSPPKFEFNVSAKTTNPAEIKAVKDAVKKGVFPQEMKIEFGGKVVPNITKSRIAVLKSAYLLAFGQFGYSYILSPFLDCVRELARTLNPTVVPLPDIVFRVAIEQLPPGIAMVIVPEQLKAIAVPLPLRLRESEFKVGYVGILPVDGTTYQRWKSWRIERGLDSAKLTYKMFPTGNSLLTDPIFTWHKSPRTPWC